MIKRSHLWPGINLSWIHTIPKLLKICSNFKPWFLDTQSILFSCNSCFDRATWKRAMCPFTNSLASIMYPFLKTTNNECLWFFLLYGERNKFGETKWLHSQLSLKVSVNELSKWKHGDTRRRESPTLFLLYYNNFTPISASENQSLEDTGCVYWQRQLYVGKCENQLIIITLYSKF